MPLQIIKEKQALADACVLATGSMDELFNMALANEVSITAIIAPGTELKHNTIDKRIPMVNELKARGAKPASRDEGNDVVLPGGIGSMSIGGSFIVS